MRTLRIHVYGAESYPIDGVTYTLEDAVEYESATVAADADARHIDDPSPEAREAFRVRVYESALFHLQHSGEYVDPIGVRWTLSDDDGEDGS